MLTNLPPVPYDFASASQFHVYTYCGVKARLAYCLNSVLNVKALIGAFNQEKALVGAFSVIVQFHRLIVCSTKTHSPNVSSVLIRLMAQSL